MADKKKVLIIEDETNIREVYAEVLQEAGFEIEQSGDGSTGYEKAVLGAWDLLLLDIMLPKKDGLQLLADIKSNDLLKNKPVILLTNLGRESIIKEGFNQGAAGYLVKSEIDPGTVVREVNKVLGLSSSDPEKAEQV